MMMMNESINHPPAGKAARKKDLKQAWKDLGSGKDFSAQV
jgi:hypothetical protein